MLSAATTYDYFKTVFSITILLLFSSFSAFADLSAYKSNYGPLENLQRTPADFTYSRKESAYQTRFHSRLHKDVFVDDGSDLQLDLSMAYANLFSPSPEGFMGFSYFTAGMDNENRLNISSSVGHFINALDGDILLSYRFIKDQRNDTLPNLGAVDDQIYENSFAASYKRYSDNFFLRETSLSYSLSTIPGEEFYASELCSVEDGGRDGHGTLVGGYGDTLTHEIGAELAFGYEELGSRFISGMKTSLGFGYEYAIQDEFYGYSAQVEESVSLLARVQHRTSFGLINTSYKYLESAQTISAGYSLHGVDFYLKEIRYEDGSDNRLLGFRLKLDLLNLKDPFKKLSKLFGKGNRTGRGHEIIGHNRALSSNNLSTLPALQKIADT